MRRCAVPSSRDLPKPRGSGARRGPQWVRRAGSTAGVILVMVVIPACGHRAVGAASPTSRSSNPSAVAGTSSAQPSSPVSSSTTTTVKPVATTQPAPPPLPRPAALAPLVSPPQPGEGQWQAVESSAQPGGYGVYTTSLRPQGGYPSAGIAWINPAATRMALYAGTAEPYGSWPQQGDVAPTQRSQLVAAFNSGFKIYSYDTGWFASGRTAVPLQAGMASLVIYANGTATVGAWGRDVTMTPSVEAVRQNLPLLVDAGLPASDVGSIAAWGATLGGVNATWRSGIGVTPLGDLVYVGGPLLDPAALARLLIAAGAVRAMELDINPEWVSFVTYTHQGPTVTGGTDLTPGMYFSPSHYLSSDGRDFVAVFSR